MMLHTGGGEGVLQNAIRENELVDPQRQKTQYIGSVGRQANGNIYFPTHLLLERGDRSSQWWPERHGLRQFYLRSNEDYERCLWVSVVVQGYER